MVQEPKDLVEEEEMVQEATVLVGEADLDLVKLEEAAVIVKEEDEGFEERWVVGELVLAGMEEEGVVEMDQERVGMVVEAEMVLEIGEMVEVVGVGQGQLLVEMED